MQRKRVLENLLVKELYRPKARSMIRTVHTVRSRKTKRTRANRKQQRLTRGRRDRCDAVTDRKEIREIYKRSDNEEEWSAAVNQQFS